MKTTFTIVGTGVVLVAGVLGLLFVFDIINSDIFKEGLGKLVLGAVVIAATVLAMLALNESGKPTKPAKK